MIRSVVDRYQTDPEFRALVDVLASQIYAARYTPTEIREAAIMASTIVEAHTIRPMLIPLRELDQIGRGSSELRGRPGARDVQSRPTPAAASDTQNPDQHEG